VTDAPASRLLGSKPLRRTEPAKPKNHIVAFFTAANLLRCWTPYASWRNNVVTILTSYDCCRGLPMFCAGWFALPYPGFASQRHAESVLGHVRPGIQGVYDQHNFFPEKREALLKWGALLRTITDPSPTGSNVVSLRA
jgi:hypothetical protein